MTLPPTEPAAVPRALPISNKTLLWLLLAAAVVVAVLALAFSTPLLGDQGRTIVMGAYRKICHQMPSRSFYVEGTQVALCHRCVGIYAAIPVAIAAFAVLRRWDHVFSARPLLTVGASLVPMGIDWALNATGIWTNTPFSRLATGALFGVAAGYFLARGIVKLAQQPDSDSREAVGAASEAASGAVAPPN